MPINPSDERGHRPAERRTVTATAPAGGVGIEEPEASEGAADASLAGLAEPATPGLGAELLALVRYLVKTEVHTYAFSVAANTILSLFPFIVLLLTISQKVFHSDSMEAVVGQMMGAFLPVGQEFVMRNMVILAHPRNGTRVFSVVMLLITSTGVFLPLEVALNDVWGVKENRSYLHNQLVSMGLAAAVGVLAITSVAMTAGQNTILSWVFFGHTHNVIFLLIAHFVVRIFAVISGILLFFLIYWILPYRSIPAMAVLPTAIGIGLLWEAAKYLYILALPWLDFRAVYGPFYLSVSLIMWAFVSGLILLAGAHFSATRFLSRAARAELTELEA